MPYKILAINPGSTSTKIAFYIDKERVLEENTEHPLEALSRYGTIVDQLHFRKQAVLDFLSRGDIEISCIDALIGRGGILPPLQSGAYKVNELMIDRLKNRTISEHASNLGALIAYELGQNKIPSFIYDPVSVDEMNEIAKITGIPEIKRRSLIHALNMRAAALNMVEKLGKLYSETTMIVAHLGGGISLSLHHEGKMTDIVSDDEGPFAPERSGRIPALLLAEECYSGRFTKKEMLKLIRGNSGLKSFLGTTNMKEIEERIKNGDENADLIYRAMSYNVAKAIGELATVVSGKVDRIVLTGGIAHSPTFTGYISEKVGFIATVVIIPGENELEALAHGAFRVLSGQENAKEYCE